MKIEKNCRAMAMASTKSALILLLITALTTLSGIGHAQAQDHPNLMLTREGVEEIRRNLGAVPLFDASLELARSSVDAEIARGIDTPIPKDYSGGYTHERHKLNYAAARNAGALFQILEDEKYAQYIRDMLFQYEAMYQDLPVHPKTRSYARGKLFWQCLNDSVWLFNMAQAYDAIYEWLPQEERVQLNENLFHPFADYLSLESPQFFKRVHNHSTWGVTAVGMIGLVMGDEELVQRALYGIPNVRLDSELKDNDGGLLIVEGQGEGFLANLEQPFSPDGYYTEGPYYQRYAMSPFLGFAVAMHNARPELGILEFEDGMLLKGVHALLNLSDADGEFFPLNDGQKGMSYYSRSLVSAVDIAYHYGDRDPGLLSVALQQGQVLLDQAGLSVAMDIRDAKAKPFAKQSLNLRDGAAGDEGGVAVLRYGSEELTLVFKYSAQGLSHGHYDKLSFSLYDQGDEVVQDYGLSRFVNIEQKGGGNYLDENKTWAKLTVAHNTLVQNESSHFDGDYDKGSLHHSALHAIDLSDEDLQIVSAKEANAYPGTEMHRTMAVVKDEGLDKPFVLDVMKVTSKKENKYDMPLYFMGQVIDVSFDYHSPSMLSPLGDSNGYQHLYLEGVGQALAESTQFTWLVNNKFYTQTSSTDSDDEMLFARLGANDPDFNLRRDAALILRRKDTSDTTFASIIEPHGYYSPVSERSVNPRSQFARVNVLHDTTAYTAVAIDGVDDLRRVFIVANLDAASATQHELEVDGHIYRWQGPFHYAR